MTMHSSLKTGEKSKQHRSVLKRLEKLLHLMKKDQWKDGNPVFGLPKVKVIKFKVKKEKTKEAEEAAAAATVAEGAPAAPGTAAAATPETQKQTLPAPKKEIARGEKR